MFYPIKPQKINYHIKSRKGLKVSWYQILLVVFFITFLWTIGLFINYLFSIANNPSAKSNLFPPNFSNEVSSNKTLPDISLSSIVKTQSQIELIPFEHESINEPNAEIIKLKVRQGDNLTKLLSPLDISLKTIAKLTQTPRISSYISHLRPGQNITVNLDEKKQLQSILLELSPTKTLTISRNLEGSFSDQITNIELDVRSNYAEGIINDSLFLAGERVGLSPNLIMEMANIFGWDIDFALDIYPGDSFRVVYQSYYKDDKKISDGPILIAQFTNKGKEFTVVRFQDKQGKNDYYTLEGKSVRKAFLRTPVAFGRVSSHFNLKRRHPILHTIRAHKGVDYAAARGTPVKATGDGKVIYVGRKGGYGKTIILQHGNNYTTLYAHLNNYSKKIRYGKRIKQGQVIGFIGSTGLATGPHLHYEFRVNNIHKNPLTVSLPRANPISKDEYIAFTQSSKDLLSNLMNHKHRYHFVQRNEL